MRPLSGREKRLLIYLALVVLVGGWDTIRRRWTHDHTLQTDHYVIYSRSTPEQTRETGVVADSLYETYIRFIRQMGVEPRHAGQLQMKIYRDRDELRFCNRIYGWAEAFYQKPYCHLYYAVAEVNHFHWMIHEAAHQLNEEVAGITPGKWLEEGIADYFGSSKIASNKLVLGEIDANTYPVWWLDTLAISGDLATDKQNASVIPLRAIISNSGGPDIDVSFNLYYLHWWSLTHFLMHYDGGKYRAGMARLLQKDGGIPAFEKHIGPIADVEREWYGYVHKLKKKIL